jgi:hypothetical protein
MQGRVARRTGDAPLGERCLGTIYLPFFLIVKFPQAAKPVSALPNGNIWFSFFLQNNAERRVRSLLKCISIPLNYSGLSGELRSVCRLIFDKIFRREHWHFRSTTQRLLALLLEKRNQLATSLVIFAIDVATIQSEACKLFLVRGLKFAHDVRLFVCLHCVQANKG